MKNPIRTGTMIALAAAGLFTAACKKAEEKPAAPAGEAAKAAPEPAAAPAATGDQAAAPAGEKTAKVHCQGVNDCKGTSGCKTETNACAGQNGCKGKGYTDMTEDECKAKGGTVLANN